MNEWTSCELESFGIFDEKLEFKDLPKTLNIGSCSQHSVHGALKMGMKRVDWNVEKIHKLMFWILHDSTRNDYYMREGQATVFPLRYLYYYQINIKCIFRAYFRKIKHPGIGPFLVIFFFLICIESVKNNFRIGSV